MLTCTYTGTPGAVRAVSQDVATGDWTYARSSHPVLRPASAARGWLLQRHRTQTTMTTMPLHRPSLRQVSLGSIFLVLLASSSLHNARYLERLVSIGDKATQGPDARPKSSAYPGRFRNESYPDLSIRVEFVNNRVSPKMLQYRRPYNATCSPGLHCQFSDTSWHEFGWSHTFVSFPESPRMPNDLVVCIESPNRSPYSDSIQLLDTDKHAGLATVDPNSDVPMSYLNGSENRIHSISYIYTPKSDEITIWRVLHVQANCGTGVSTDRMNLLRALMRRGLVDSMGRCEHTVDYNATAGMIYVPGGKQAKNELMRRYAFVTAFENSYYPGYVSEKLLDALASGTLPIYLGAPNVWSMLPRDSLLNANDFPTYDALADHIEYLIESRAAYDGYHSWRGGDIPTALREYWKFGEEDENCRFCRWGAENLFLRV